MNAADDQGNTPVHYAVHCRAYSALKKFGEFRMVNPNLRNMKGKTPLIDAVMGMLVEDTSTFRTKIKERRKMSLIVSLQLKTALHNFLPAVQILLNFPLIDPNVPCEEQHARTPLIMAAEIGNENALEELMKHPKCDVNLVDK